MRKQYTQINRDRNPLASIDRPVEISGYGFTLDGIPIEEEELFERILTDPASTLKTRQLTREQRSKAAWSAKGFYLCIMAGALFGYILFLTLRGYWWIWVGGMGFIGMLGGIVAFSVLRAEASRLLWLMVDSYNLDRGYRPVDHRTENADERTQGTL